MIDSGEQISSLELTRESQKHHRREKPRAKHLQQQARVEKTSKLHGSMAWTYILYRLCMQHVNTYWNWTNWYSTIYHLRCKQNLPRETAVVTLSCCEVEYHASALYSWFMPLVCEHHKVQPLHGQLQSNTCNSTFNYQLVFPDCLAHPLHHWHWLQRHWLLPPSRWWFRRLSGSK